MSIKTKDMIICSICASIVSILAQISIPITQVSFTMQVFAVSLVSLILSPKKSFLVMIIYILIGGVGLPVFSNMQGGIGVLLGPTGGFILSFPFMAYTISYIANKANKTYIILSGMIIGLSITYIMGMIQFMMITELGIREAFLNCILPFILFDLIKIIMAFIVSKSIQKRVKIQ